MHFARIRVGDVTVTTLPCKTLDFVAGAELIGIVDESLAEGARCVVLAFPPGAKVDFGGARAIATMKARLGPGCLGLAGLSTTALRLLRATRIADGVGIHEWWTDAVEAVSRAA